VRWRRAARVLAACVASLMTPSWRPGGDGRTLHHCCGSSGGVVDLQIRAGRRWPSRSVMLSPGGPVPVADLARIVWVGIPGRRWHLNRRLLLLLASPLHASLPPSGRAWITPLAMPTSQFPATRSHRSRTSWLLCHFGRRRPGVHRGSRPAGSPLTPRSAGEGRHGGSPALTSGASPAAGRTALT